ncbi:hypothetical protein SCN94_09530, partial [Legionella pneumophila serogroup 8]
PLLGRSLRKTVVKISNFKATGLLRRYAPRNDGPKNRTVQRSSAIKILPEEQSKTYHLKIILCII